MKGIWWKILAVALILYSYIFGFKGSIPHLPILRETIRNLYFHVPMWFAMIVMMGSSMVFGILHLSKFKNKQNDNPLENDTKSVLFATSGLVFASLGLLTGMLWAKFTWGAFWTNDPKLNGSAITMLIYLAYFVLRGSIEDQEKKAQISAVYNIFAFFLMIVFIGILPRLTDSLHPGNGGNPAFGSYDLDNNMRTVFYPAVIGWIMFGFWLTNVKIRLKRVSNYLDKKENNFYESIK
ncbi:MAG: cytochrome c biogenesis protein [Schleiferiaceae bacterium]|jgi:heme exporter protein C|nr:cytochrome c biogenesis protein [Schleiferiaceae bacterium]